MYTCMSSAAVEPPPAEPVVIEMLTHDTPSKIVAVFYYSNGCSEHERDLFFGLKRPRVALSSTMKWEPVSDLKFIRRATAICEEALRGLLGHQHVGSATWSCSYTVEAKGKRLTIVCNGGPYLHGLSARRAFGAALEDALRPFAAFTPGLGALYQLGAVFRVVQARKGARRPLTPNPDTWDADDFAQTAYEPTVTAEVLAAHSVAFTPRPGEPPIFFQPEGALELPDPGGKLDAVLAFVRARSGANFTLADVDATACVEEGDAAFARVVSGAAGFTCPAGILHGAGTAATVELRGGCVTLTCEGPQRLALAGFGRFCCREHYGALPRPLFELPADEYVLCIVDENGVERAVPLTLEQLDAYERCKGSGEGNVVVLRMRMGSGKSEVALKLAAGFLKKFTDGRLVFASSHRSLTKASLIKLRKLLGEGVEVLHYKEATGEARNRLYDAHVVVCTSSLSVCVGRGTTRPTLLVVDEPESTASMVSALGGVQGVANIARALSTCSNLRVVMLDSHADTATMRLAATAGLKLHIVEGASRPCKHFSSKITYAATMGQKGLEYCNYYAAVLVARHVWAGQSVLVPCSTKVLVGVMGKALRSELGAAVEVLTITGDDTSVHQEHVVAVVEGRRARAFAGVPLVVLYTATMGIGLSAATGLFQKLVGAVSISGPSPQAFVQMLGRRRSEGVHDRLLVEVVVADQALALGSCATWLPDKVPLDFRSMNKEDQKFVLDHRLKDVAIASLREREFLSRFGLAVDPGCGPHFLKKDDEDKVTRFTKQPFSLFNHEEAKEEATHFARLAGAARRTRGIAAFHEVEAGAHDMSHTYTGCPFQDLVLTTPVVEKATRGACYMSRLEQLLEWEFGTVCKPEMVLRPAIDERESRLLAACGKACLELAFDDAVTLARNLKESWFLDSPAPLYCSEQARFKAMVAIARAAKAGGGAVAVVEEHEVLEEVDGTGEFWDDARRQKVFIAVTLGVGDANARRLVDKVLAYAQVVASRRAEKCSRGGALLGTTETQCAEELEEAEEAEPSAMRRRRRRRSPAAPSRANRGRTSQYHQSAALATTAPRRSWATCTRKR